MNYSIWKIYYFCKSGQIKNPIKKNLNVTNLKKIHTNLKKPKNSFQVKKFSKYF